MKSPPNLETHKLLTCQKLSTWNYISNIFWYSHFSKAFLNTGKDVLILKEIFDEWIEKYLKVNVAQNLIKAQDFVDSFLFEFGLFKSLLRYFTILFHNYEVN